MQAFTQHEGLVAPLDRENVDTDLIIPKQFLKSIKRAGWPQPVRRTALPGPWRTGHGQQQASAQPGFRAEPAALPGASVLLARKISAAVPAASTRPGR